MTIACIYAIVNNVTGRRYIGSTINCAKRWNEHRHYLRRDTHMNTHLNRAWDKYGEDAFSWIIVEPIDDVATLGEREQWYLSEAWPNVYNKGRFARNAHLGTKASDDHKARLRNGWIKRRERERAIHEANRLKREAQRAERAEKRRHCANGHEWTPENTSFVLKRHGTVRWRQCLACAEARRITGNHKYRSIHGPDPRIGSSLGIDHRSALKAAWAQKRANGEPTRGPLPEDHKAKLREAWVRRKARIA